MTANRSNAIISLSNLSYSYNGARHTAVQDLTLDIPTGSVTAILGPNGSGKTTLLRLLLGVLRPKQGAIRIAGQPQGSYTRQELSQMVGLVPQDEHIPFDFSILEYVLLGRAPYLKPLATPGEKDRRVALDALETTGLTHLQHRPLPNLSGGERQLAILARALAQCPHILLMDEPSAHLDLGNKGRLLAIVRRLATEGITLVLTTHDPNLAASVADFAVLMHKGQVLDAGPAGAVLTQEKLSATYGLELDVVDVNGKQVILLP